jgi:hypothetical protein
VVSTDLPSVNQLVYVTVEAELTYRTRIEDAEADALTIAAPIGVGDLEPPEPGADLEVSWIAGRNRYVVPVNLTSISRQQPPSWSVRVTGERRRETRRLYVRGGGGEKVRLGSVLDPRMKPTGVIIDVSEGGVRCRLPWCAIVVGDTVRVDMALDQTLAVVGRVLSVRDAAEAAGELDVVVVYDLTDGMAQEIRRYVLQREMAERRAKADAAAQQSYATGSNR